MADDCPDDDSGPVLAWWRQRIFTAVERAEEFPEHDPRSLVAALQRMCAQTGREAVLERFVEVGVRLFGEKPLKKEVARRCRSRGKPIPVEALRVRILVRNGMELSRAVCAVIGGNTNGPHYQDIYNAAKNHAAQLDEVLTVFEPEPTLPEGIDPTLDLEEFRNQIQGKPPVKPA
jgi:hypothetical protein